MDATLDVLTNQLTSIHLLTFHTSLSLYLLIFYFSELCFILISKKSIFYSSASSFTLFRIHSFNRDLKYLYYS